MFRKPVREINAEYQANEASLISIRTLVRETLINAGFARKDVHAANLAIEEGVTNIIRHAYLYEEGIISAGQGAYLLKMDRLSFERFLAEAGFFHDTLGRLRNKSFVLQTGLYTFEFDL